MAQKRDGLNPARFIVHNDDPLGLRKIVLGGAPPSLEVEAEIALRQWAIEDGGKGHGQLGRGDADEKARDA